VWKQSQADNPNPAVSIPVPIVGFSELCWKYKCHNEQVTVHKLTLNSIADRVSELARKKQEWNLSWNNIQIKWIN